MSSRTTTARFVDPRSGAHGISADDERLISIVAEAGERFTYRYDFGDDWTHTVTLEEVREGGPENSFHVLDGAGACPPEDCGGPFRYVHLVRALADPADPDHDDAIDLLGEGYDPAQYEPAPTIDG
jgi:hypothetical protein